jgi:hypothetical protein
MQVLDKVVDKPFICKIELDFNGNLTALKGQQKNNFFNSEGNFYTWINAHFGKRTVSFKETSKETTAGDKFTQTLKIKFPSTDTNRSERIQLFKKAKFVNIHLSTGVNLVFGRNDYYQNRKPKITISSDHQFTSVTIKQTTMFPLGTLEKQDTSAFINSLIPLYVPTSFINI